MCNPAGWYERALAGQKTPNLAKILMHRNGSSISWPDFDVEGELYFGKNSLHSTGSLRSSSNPKNWEQVCFHIFDTIDYRLTWLERHEKLKYIEQNDRIKVVIWLELKSVQHLEEEYKNIINHLGEGVVIADPGERTRMDMLSKCSSTRLPGCHS